MTERSTTVDTTAEPRLSPGESAADISEERWQSVMVLPCRLRAALAIPKFKVRQAVALHVGSVVNTGSEEGSNVPLFINGQLIGWGRFEVVGSRLAIQIAELL